MDWLLIITFRFGWLCSPDGPACCQNSILIPGVFLPIVDDHIAKDHIILDSSLVRLLLVLVIVLHGWVDGSARLGHQLEAHHLFRLDLWHVRLPGILSIDHSDATQFLRVCVRFQVRLLLGRHFTLVTAQN